jgi:3-hydroxyisobutyrate dehydrogenase
MPVMKIGFIGLGTMGGHMAANLQRAGHKLVVHDVNRAAAESHLAAGAEWADTPRAVAERSDVVFTSLPGPAEVEAVVFGKDGLLEGVRQGLAYFDLSTNSQALMRRVHEAFRAKGADACDAPVSGGPEGARTGKLAIWVGGDEAVYRRHKPVLDAIGDQARYIGPIGSATVAKLVHNMAGYAINQVMAEVFSMGVKAGMDPLALWEAIRQGALGRRRTFDRIADQYLIGRYEPPAFALKLAHKDVSLAVQLGRELGVPMRLCNLTHAEMTEALNRGWGALDSRVFMRLQNERAGVEIAAEAERVQAVLKADGK